MVCKSVRVLPSEYVRLLRGSVATFAYAHFLKPNKIHAILVAFFMDGFYWWKWLQGQHKQALCDRLKINGSEVTKAVIDGMRKRLRTVSNRRVTTLKSVGLIRKSCFMIDSELSLKYSVNLLVASEVASMSLGRQEHNGMRAKNHFTHWKYAKFYTNRP